MTTEYSYSFTIFVTDTIQSRKQKQATTVWRELAGNNILLSLRRNMNVNG